MIAPLVPLSEWMAGARGRVPSILRLPAVLKIRGRSRSSHYLDIQQGLFTSPISLGARAVGWPEYEVAALNAARIAGKGDEEVRALVFRLQESRRLAA